MSDPKALVLAGLEALNRGELDRYYDSLAEDFRYVTPAGTLIGRNAAREADTPLFRQFSRHWRIADRIVAGGNKVVVWLRFGGTVRATGASFEVSLCDIFHVANGRIQSLEMHGDLSPMVAALTATPASEAAIGCG